MAAEAAQSEPLRAPEAAPRHSGQPGLPPGQGLQARRAALARLQAQGLLLGAERGRHAGRPGLLAGGPGVLGRGAEGGGAPVPRPAVPPAARAGGARPGPAGGRGERRADRGRARRAGAHPSDRAVPRAEAAFLRLRRRDGQPGGLDRDQEGFRGGRRQAAPPPGPAPV